MRKSRRTAGPPTVLVWGDGAVEDTITFVQGRLRVIVAVFGESLGPDHVAVRALAQAARRRLAG